MENKEKSVFETLSGVDVSKKTENKNGLTYLSWAWAWAEVKKKYIDTSYKVYERDSEFGPINYFTDGKTCWVKTGVTINGVEYIDMLPVMDYKNKSIPYDKVTSFDVNKSIQRSITKALARHGLGLYIYAGEDLPEENTDEIIKAFLNCQTKMGELGIDFRNGKTYEWIMKHTEAQSQDVGKATIDEMKILIKAYNTLIQKKEKTEAPGEKEKPKEEVGEVDFGL